MADLLLADGVDYQGVPVESETRINTSILLPSGRTLKVNGPGSPLSPADLSRVLGCVEEALAGLADAGAGADSGALADSGAVVDRWLVIAGSLPPGLDADIVAQLIGLAHSYGVPVAVDVSGAALRAALSAGADLLAPNEIELGELLGGLLLENAADVAAAARALATEHGLARDTRRTCRADGPRARLGSLRLPVPDYRRPGSRKPRYGRDPRPRTRLTPPQPKGMLMSENTIRRIVVTAVGEMSVREEAPSPVRSGEVRVRSVTVGVCGSDTHAFHGRHPLVPIPYFPGHEATGVVTELGDGVDSVAVGTRVTVEPTLPCWNCKQCRSGQENLCENLQFFGCGYEQGGMADEFVVRADRLHVIPDELDDRAASLIEPLSTPVHAGRIAGPLQDKAVVIMGSGTIGLLMLAVARYEGARRVVVTDPLASKRDLALRLGADAAVDSTSPDVVGEVREALGESADVVFDCVAIQPTISAAIALATKGGTVAIVGVPSADVTIPTIVVQDNQVRIQGCATYVPQDYAKAIEMLVAGAVRGEDFVTAEFPLDQAREAFDASISGQHIKVLVRP